MRTGIRIESRSIPRAFVVVGLLLTVALWLVGVALQMPRASGLAMAITGFLLHVLLYALCDRMAAGVFAPRFILFGNGFIAVGLFLSFLIGSDLSLGSFPVNIVSARPLAALIGWISVPIGVAIFALVSAPLFGDARNRGGTSVVRLLNQAPRNLQGFLVAASLISFLAWFATADESNSRIAFAVRVLMRLCPFVPLAVGYYWDRFRIALVTWSSTFALGLYFSFITGSRGYVFLPLMLFLLGIVARQYVKQRLVSSAVVLVPLAVFLIMLGGIIGLVRDELGRTHVGLEGEGAVAERASVAQGVVRGSQAKVGSGNPVENIAFRLVPWCNLTVPVISVEEVPSRGFGDILVELKAAFYVASISGVVYAGGYYSNDYGFYTGEGSSVEWGIVADAWSRGGFFAAVAYGFIGALILSLLELGLGALAGPRVEWRIMIALVVFGIAWFEYSRSGLIYGFRSGTISALILCGLMLVHRAVYSRHGRA